MKSTHLELSLSEATSTSCGRSLALPVSLRDCTHRTILLALAFEISHWNFLSLVFVSVFKLPTTGWLRGTTSEIVLSSSSINDDQSQCPRHCEVAMDVKGFERG